MTFCQKIQEIYQVIDKLLGYLKPFERTLKMEPQKLGLEKKKLTEKIKTINLSIQKVEEFKKNIFFSISSFSKEFQSLTSYFHDSLDPFLEAFKQELSISNQSENKLLGEIHKIVHSLIDNTFDFSILPEFEIDRPNDNDRIFECNTDFDNTLKCFEVINLNTLK